MKKMLLRMTGLLLPVMLIFTMMGSAFAVESSGACGENASWALSGDGVLTVTGSGEMADCSSGAPWAAHMNDITEVVIGEGMLSVGKNAFYGYPNLTKVTLPDTLLYLEPNAFAYCGRLAQCALPAKLKFIGFSCFANTAITGVVIPRSVTFLGPGAFQYCGQLTSVLFKGSTDPIKAWVLSLAAACL